MKPTRIISAEDYQLQGAFQAVRSLLLSERYADRLDTPLGYWALPKDRRLPFAFLDRTLNDILHTSFSDLQATPGVGPKKITSLVKLLDRASKEEPTNSNANTVEEGCPSVVVDSSFDPSTVSELTWRKWRDTVRQANLGHVRFGRLAASLREAPSVIWETPLKYYLDYTLSEIRQLRAHGEKRVRTVLEVFHAIHRILENAPCDRRLAIRLAPWFVPGIESWIHQKLETAEPVDWEEMREHLIQPLLDQIAVDGGPDMRDLAETRLGIGETSINVREQARQLGVTRARVYQLFEECAAVMKVRWYEGGHLLDTLFYHARTCVSSEKTLDTLDEMQELLFPRRRARR
ncbi:hypothetical protein [Lignipirellula cremea]|uniref:Uncharacterized protein n=1 Tax=Lignipirellula cremea TaxID=2528010 RepID=A0A518DNT3_9BACT|nr:hypothetical protein [Lignipirellula cremea]QDU93496.1 hypothetical protein Pla8534_12760 [Lignipirellula cremea]